MTAAAGLLPAPTGGRVIVAVGTADQGEPRLRVGALAPNPLPIFAEDIVDFGQAQVWVDDRSAAFPYRSLGALPSGTYRAQAILDVSRDLRSVNAAGNYYSQPQRFTVTDDGGSVVRLELSEQIAPAGTPAETAYLRFLEIPSRRLSDFHGRPIRLRAGVVLPRGYDTEPARRYPVRVHVGGYGARYTDVARLMRPGTAFRAAWLRDDTPRMLLVHLDGAGPNGDPYQVNSDNNGPYGDAVVHELLPLLESRFRGRGTGEARVIDGESTGGWVALALQLFYPDAFNGAWSYCPDAVDFRQLQVIDIYDDKNVYVDANGEERPAARTPRGVVRFTMRHELGLENALGSTSSWTRSGRQWGAWNAAFGPKGENGYPIPLFDPLSGEIDRTVAEHWASYDLSRHLAGRWSELAPALEGKLRIWIGESDDYFLNNAVHLLDDFLGAQEPSLDVRIEYGVGRGHCWVGATPYEIMQQMGARTGAFP